MIITNEVFPKPERINFGNEIPFHFEVVRLNDDSSGLSIFLEYRKELWRAKVNFETNWLYLNCDEGQRSEYWRSFGGVLLAGIYKAEKSELLNWITANNYGIAHDNLIHYIVVSNNDVVDIISADNPVLELY